MQERIMRLADENDAAVGRRDDGIGVARQLPRRIAKKLRNENRDQPKRQGKPKAEANIRNERNEKTKRDERPAFASDDGVGIGHY